MKKLLTGLTLVLCCNIQALEQTQMCQDGSALLRDAVNHAPVTEQPLVNNVLQNDGQIRTWLQDNSPEFAKLSDSEKTKVVLDAQSENFNAGSFILPFWNTVSYISGPPFKNTGLRSYAATHDLHYRNQLKR